MTRLLHRREILAEQASANQLAFPGYDAVAVEVIDPASTDMRAWTLQLFRRKCCHVSSCQDSQRNAHTWPTHSAADLPVL